MKYETISYSIRPKRLGHIKILFSTVKSKLFFKFTLWGLATVYTQVFMLKKSRRLDRFCSGGF